MNFLRPDYRRDGKTRVHSWVGIISVLIPAALVAMVVVDQLDLVSLQPLVGDVEGFAIVAFGVGTLYAAMAVIEAHVRGKRRLLPILSFGAHMAIIALAAAVWIVMWVSMWFTGPPTGR